MSSPFPIITSAAGFAEALELNPAVAGELINQIGAKRARKLFALDKHYPEVFDPEAPDLREAKDNMVCCLEECTTKEAAEAIADILGTLIDSNESILATLVSSLADRLGKMTAHHFEEDEALALKAAITQLHESVQIE